MKSEKASVGSTCETGDQQVIGNVVENWGGQDCFVHV
jgi:hypothetical protein